MNPAMIMALMSAAMPIFQELLALGAQIAAATQAAQGYAERSTADRAPDVAR